MTNPSGRILFFVLIVIVLAGCISSTPKATATPTPVPVKGAPGIGDSYYETMGNGGYDVQNYLIALDVDPITNKLEGSVTITAMALEYLGAFNLDSHALSIDAITVNNQEAAYTETDDELTVTPAQALDANKTFTVVIAYHGEPTLFVSSNAAPFPMGWSHSEDGSINVWGEPEAAKTWFPNNNHPRDKATYRFEITVLSSWTVAATGVLKDTVEKDGRTTFIWEMNQPMATYLASISIDRYELITQTGPNGMTIRNYFPVDLPEVYRSDFEIIPEAIDLFDDLFGPYPFDEYGVVVAAEGGLCGTVDLALEAQSMSIHCPSATMTSDWVIVHELAHMWFGDSVSLEKWQDVWLKEGFATYAEWLWITRKDPEKMTAVAKSKEKFFFDSDYPVAAPDPQDIYTDESYSGGALVLQALRLEVGDETFFNILRAYSERYKYSAAGTDEFIALAEEISGKDLQSFFDTWLFSSTMPDLP